MRINPQKLFQNPVAHGRIFFVHSAINQGIVEVKDRILAIRQVRNFNEQQVHFEQNTSELADLIQFIDDRHAYPLPEYGSWILTHLAKNNPRLIQKYEHQLIDFLFTTANQSVLRNITNTLSSLKISDYRESDLIDLLISFIQRPENKVALQVYAMYCLVQFIRKYPELKQEICEVIAINEEGKSPAYFAGKRNFEAALKKI